MASEQWGLFGVIKILQLPYYIVYIEKSTNGFCKDFATVYPF